LNLWKHFLEDALEAIEPVELASMKLERDHPQYQDALLAAACSPTGHSFQGQGWPLNFRKHCNVRKALEKLLDRKVPSCKEFWTEALVDASTSPNTDSKVWVSALCDRERDLLYLHKFALKYGENNGMGEPAEMPPLHWDLAGNVCVNRNKSISMENVLPCISKNHTIWDVVNMKPWLGLELMRAQGFPEDCKLKFSLQDPTIPPHIKTAIAGRLRKSELSDYDLHAMAGNTMSIPIMFLLQAPSETFQGSLLALILQTIPT